MALEDLLQTLLGVPARLGQNILTNLGNIGGNLMGGLGGGQGVDALAPGGAGTTFGGGSDSFGQEIGIPGFGGAPSGYESGGVQDVTGPSLGQLQKAIYLQMVMRSPLMQGQRMTPGAGIANIILPLLAARSMAPVYQQQLAGKQAAEALKQRQTEAAITASQAATETSKGKGKYYENKLAEQQANEEWLARQPPAVQERYRAIQAHLEPSAEGAARLKMAEATLRGDKPQLMVTGGPHGDVIQAVQPSKVPEGGIPAPAKKGARPLVDDKSDPNFLIYRDPDNPERVLTQVPREQPLPKVSANIQKLLAEGETRLKQVDRLMAQEDRIDKYTGPWVAGIKGKLQQKGYISGLTKEQSDFYAEANNFYADALHFYTGAQLSEKEVGWRKDSIPSIENGPTYYKSQLLATKHNLETMVDELRKQSGRPAGGAPQAAAPTGGAIRIESGADKGTVFDTSDAYEEYARKHPEIRKAKRSQEVAEPGSARKSKSVQEMTDEELLKELGR